MKKCLGSKSFCMC